MSGPPLVRPFEANGFSLEPGVRLLEASAGTGKTFALAHLVLRLVTRPRDPLRLEQLLVVTFTNAAAAELRDRIAARLQLALALLEAGPGSWANHPQLERDQPLREWLQQQPEATASVRGRLLLALEDLDNADITTIHGFCRRTLQRQALEAGLGPAVELERDPGEAIGQICHDYWQQQVLPLAPELLAGLQQRGLQLERLQQLLRQLDGDPALSLDPLPAELGLDQPLAPQLESLWPQLWQRFCGEWASRGEALEQALCQTAQELKSHGAKTGPYRLRPTGRDGQVSAWIAAQGTTVPGYLEVLAFSNSAKTTRERLLLDVFHPGPFVKVTAPLEGEGRSLPERPLLEAIAALVDGPAELALLHFAHWSRRELARRRSRQGRMGFGQLLEELDPGTTGSDEAGATALIGAVADRYRAALIDEFQDTDPIQWRILERAFTAAPGQHARHLLVMVGDPKQAIYRFRGGELATYRLASSRADDIHGLTQNRRSSAGLVAGLNALMTPPGLPRSGLAVPEVEACATTGDLALPPGGAPLQLLPLEPEQLPRQVAALCLQLLRSHPLEPSDLCLLVSRHSQAEELRHALEQRGLPSRLVSKGDVFASEGATSLQRLLDALAEPGNSNRQRLLAATPLLGWSAARIAATSPVEWDALADRLCRLAAALPRQGLMAALGQLLEERQLAALSLRGRALADLQQAAELVQEQMHRQALGVAAAADWLRRLRRDPDRDPPEAHQPRSDAAESAVAVVTVHRSKGLEYPVVICPYLWMAPQPARAGAEGLGKRWTPPDGDGPRLDLHLNPHWGRGRAAALQHQQAQEQEAERLAYVACTRARQLLVLGWHADAKQAANPLASWLLDASGQPRDLPLQQLDPDQLPAPGERWQPPAPGGQLQCAPRPLHPLDSHWGRSSYSAWTHGAAGVSPQAADEGRDTDALSSEALTLEPEAQQHWPLQGPLAQFPRGAGPGDALHRILERIDYQQPAHQPATAAVVERELERAGLDPAQQSPLLEGLEQLRLTPLGGPLGPFRLADLPRQQRLNEMNFDLPLAVTAGLVRASGLARVFREHPGGLFGSAYAAQLGQLEVASRGFLTGSIDLVFRCGERWWVADWKSNWLGERDAQGQPLACGPAHYGQAAMVELMAANHYPLQAHLYLVALHRYLRWRLPGYEPQRHLGGYAYVFLRGAPGPLEVEQNDPSVPGMLVEQPPLQRLLALDTLLREGQP
jgi:exodeoxyribonuclease V beta subunit